LRGGRSQSQGGPSVLDCFGMVMEHDLAQSAADVRFGVEQRILPGLLEVSQGQLKGITEKQRPAPMRQQLHTRSGRASPQGKRILKTFDSKELRRCRCQAWRRRRRNGLCGKNLKMRSPWASPLQPVPRPNGEFQCPGVIVPGLRKPTQLHARLTSSPV